MFHGGAGYVLVHWGIRVACDDPDKDDVDWPALSAREAISGELHVYQLWLIQAYRPGYPLAAERRWHPDLGILDAIVGLREGHRRADVLAANRGHKILVGYLAMQAGGGRHKGDGDRWLSDQEAMSDIDRELSSGARSAIAIATRLGVDRSPIYRRIKSATDMRFSEYVSSREFTQHRER